MSSIQVQHHFQRAIDFFDAMVFLREDRAYWNSSALLSVHSALSYSDALRRGLGDEDLASDNHERAADKLESLLTAKHFGDTEGLKHLRFLLKRKSVVAYSAKRMEHTDYESLFTHAERFAQWADVTARKLNISGWKHEDRQ